jgi:hypothetical protein
VGAEGGTCVAVHCYALHWLDDLQFKFLNASTRPSYTHICSAVQLLGTQGVDGHDTQSYGCTPTRNALCHVTPP